MSSTCGVARSLVKWLVNDQLTCVHTNQLMHISTTSRMSLVCGNPRQDSDTLSYFLLDVFWTSRVELFSHALCMNNILLYRIPPRWDHRVPHNALKETKLT